MSSSAGPAADSILLSPGESAVIPDERDSLAALEDCAVLLTAALASRLSWRRSRDVR